MPEKLEGPAESPPSLRTYWPLFIVELFRTLRFAIVGAVIYGCFRLATSCITDIFTDKHTVWSVLAIVATSFFGTSTPVILLFWRVVRRFQSYIAKQQDRIRILELDKDPPRTTSGLLEDGSHPNDL